MPKGIGVSPGIVVGVAHRVESVFGSIEQQALDSPAEVPAEMERFDRAVRETAVELGSLVEKVSQELRRPTFLRATSRSSTTRN
jgi:phosphotransferase system enzyme I (PtsI)